MSSRILDVVKSPADLKVLTDEDLGILAAEIREEIISTTSKTGGHVASSLGAVEIILAAHSLLDSPKDKLVFDVGHQAYAHKLITGRLDGFQNLRSYGGVSGFPRPQESEHDVHPSGHASDSLSVAVGLAKARVLKGTDEKIVTIIGDASLSGGMAFEALNYVGHAQLPMVIILNDNEMSISRNVGGLVRHLGNMRTTSRYREARDGVQERLETSGRVGRGLVNFGRGVKESVKQMVLPHTMMFEQLGIVCTAPIGGHDIRVLKETLEVCLAMDAPVLMHVVTKKGAGYGHATKDPERFHGVGPYDIATGKGPAKKEGAPPSYTDVFGAALVREAQADERVVAITAAMQGGTGLKAFAKEFPDRFVDVGIAEEHAVGMASGLAAGGRKPVVAVYSTFMQRALDQMIINCALPNFDVVFALDRAGLVGEDGPTHHGTFDIAYTRMIPNMKVLAPSDEAELVHGLHTALAIGGPVAIRYPRGSAVGVPVPEEPSVLEVGKSRILREGNDVAILAFGRMVSRCLGAADLLAEEGIGVRVVDMRWVKPLDEEAILAAARECKLLLTAEGGVISGGAGEGVLSVLAAAGESVPTLLLGLPDEFVTHGNTELLAKELGLDAHGIARQIREKLSCENQSVDNQ
ncbi:MAG: 1-deoxy-D-xylulose-5-phosphate synthase [Eggerthellaceae bacterium]|nr:1-deoxy-D-xylulose-5-phosphate synthase [Eggerthellaceae bacterium]